MLLFKISNRDESVRIDRRPGSNEIEISDRVQLIKIVRNATQCTLFDAKQFVDVMLKELNKINPQPETLRNKISSEIAEMDTDNLLDIYRFVLTCKDYPKPEDR